MERWLPVVGFDGYEISDFGDARSVDRWITFSDGRQRFYRGQPLIVMVQKKTGYRYINVRRLGRFFIHVAMLEAFVGPRPTGAEARHLDDDPAHNLLPNLAWGTRSQNQRDRVLNGRDPNANKTHCASGHEYSPGNTYIYPDGHRACRICVARWQREYRNRKKG